VALNSDGVDVGPLTASNSLRFSLVQGFMDRYYPALKTTEPATTATAKSHAQLAAGEYWVSQQVGPNFMQAVWLFAEYFSLKVSIRANDDGTITTPGFLNFLTGRPQTWREIGPFNWQEVDGDSTLQMLVQDGRVKAFAKSDVLAAFDFQRPSTLRSAGLNVPLLLGAATILLLSAIMWPVIFFVRRHYRISSTLSNEEMLGWRLTNVAAILAIVYGVSWILLVSALSKANIDPWIRLVQCIGLLCVAGAAISAWNAWLTLKRRRSIWARIWTILITLALIEVVGFSFAFHLISWNVNY
jgi:hypothetical protein